jgi:hypothetical protein
MYDRVKNVFEEMNNERNLERSGFERNVKAYSKSN